MQIFLISSSILLILILIKLVYIIFWVAWIIGRRFKKQGIRGPPYRPIFGNTSEIRRMYTQVQSKPIKHVTVDNETLLNHDICHRVMPFYHEWSGQYGKTFLYWFGVRPMVAISDPDMIQEVLMNTNGSFKKVKHNSLARMLFGYGLVGLEGDKWAFHRRIANQAFNMERVKGIVYVPRPADDDDQAHPPSLSLADRVAIILQSTASLVRCCAIGKGPILLREVRETVSNLLSAAKLMASEFEGDI